MRGSSHQLDVELGQEIERLELVICRLFRALASVSILGGLIVYLVLDLQMAASCAFGAAVLLVWFSVEERIRDRRSPPRWLRVANALVESTIPWLFFVIIIATQGPAYALGSWVPPLLYAALVVASTARLRPGMTLLLTTSGAVIFPVLYFGFVRGMLPAAVADEPLYSPPMQISRALSLAAGGVLASLIARHLRRSLRRAHGRVRERDLFGKYRLERRIGSGGMGIVYAATYCPEGGFERPVAVKQIHEHLASDDKLVAAFRHEAELSARLVHPNIVQVLDFGRIGDRYFLALEYVDGITLSELLKHLREEEELLALDVVAYVAREILTGLAYSHGSARDAEGKVMRIVHRDLCPANVMLSANGEVKITDFGVARALKDVESAPSTSVVGHVAYISPEQARALPVDERSDLFSCGTIVWEMLCNRRLFHRGAEAPTLMALVHGEVPPPSKERSLFDTGWDTLVMSALEREVDERASSAAELLHLLDKIDAAHSPEDMPDALSSLVRACRAEMPAKTDEPRTVELGAEPVTQVRT